MNEKKYLKIIFIIFYAFLVHLFLYYIVTPYGNFFKNVKNNNQNKEEIFSDYDKNDEKLDDIFMEDVLDYPDEKGDEENSFVRENIVSDNNSNVIVESKKNSDSLFESLSEKKYARTSELDVLQKEFLNKFSKYNLREIIVSKNSRIFGITDEYPYKYSEYYSKENGLYMYFFLERSYNDILSIFDVISYTSFFGVKKVNNFGDLSFYINLDNDYNDNNIRIILKYRKRIYGLRMKKSMYKEVKSILLKL